MLNHNGARTRLGELDPRFSGGSVSLNNQRLTYSRITELRHRSVDLRLSCNRKCKSPVPLLLEEPLLIQPDAGIRRIRKQLVLSIIVRIEICQRVISAMFEITAKEELMLESLGIG